MKLTWKNQNKIKKRPLAAISQNNPNLPFDPDEDQNISGNKIEERFTTGTAQTTTSNDDVRSKDVASDVSEISQLTESFQAQGNKLAEDGKYREALGKWEAALTLMPERAALHEQKAQVLLEVGETWKSVKAASRATELEPTWAEAWITLGRAQLNFGEPDSAIESFDRALAIQPDSVEARDDRKTALNLVRKRKQLHSSGLSADKNRYVVGEKAPEGT